MTRLADRLYDWRHAYRLSQHRAAEELGVNVRTWNRWERGHSVPSATDLHWLLELISGPPASWTRRQGDEL